MTPEQQTMAKFERAGMPEDEARALLTLVQRNERMRMVEEIEGLEADPREIDQGDTVCFKQGVNAAVHRLQEIGR